MFRKEWKGVELIDNPNDRFEKAQTESIIAPVPSSSSVVSYAVPIGVSSVIIVIITAAVVVFFRQKSSPRNNEQMKVSYHSNDNAKELQPEPQPQRGEASKPEDHIYEEIKERECPYDHLKFEFNPMPIATENQHYHNFTLVNRDRGTQP